MKKIILTLTAILASTSAFAAPTQYELSQALVTLTNANNEADGPYSFLVCQTEGSFYEAEEFSIERSVSEFLVLRSGGETDGVFQVNYSVVTSYAFVVQSIIRLNHKVVSDFVCPENTFQVYTESVE